MGNSIDRNRAGLRPVEFSARSRIRRNPKFCDQIADTETSGKIPSQNSDAKLGIPPMTFPTAKIIVPCQLS
ncbi:MAG: hypothetical protein E5Y64_31765 [Mesorhizobium sp.]|uniref:hypothetical protein n=1 Tax=Mesorhizobium sp. TaxID=1871066 RepID=UPI0011FD92D5|nr:hypothetical protein [Mesorhizobium sp.]TIL97251.1 MAG: hypothetical protein E5Y64_31765 [Mesorhizobium sp.]